MKLLYTYLKKSTVSYEKTVYPHNNKKKEDLIKRICITNTITRRTNYKRS